MGLFKLNISSKINSIFCFYPVTVHLRKACHVWSTIHGCEASETSSNNTTALYRSNITKIKPNDGQHYSSNVTQDIAHVPQSNDTSKYYCNQITKNLGSGIYSHSLIGNQSDHLLLVIHLLQSEKY